VGFPLMKPLVTLLLIMCALVSPIMIIWIRRRRGAAGRPALLGHPAVPGALPRPGSTPQAAGRGTIRPVLDVRAEVRLSKSGVARPPTLVLAPRADTTVSVVLTRRPR
jgi:hypothetical protein